MLRQKRRETWKRPRWRLRLPLRRQRLWKPHRKLSRRFLCLLQLQSLLSLLRASQPGLRRSPQAPRTTRPQATTRQSRLRTLQLRLRVSPRLEVHPPDASAGLPGAVGYLASRRCMTRRRVTKPEPSRKLFDVLLPGSTGTSTPVAPRRVAQSVSSASSFSPTPTSRAAGST